MRSSHSLLLYTSSLGGGGAEKHLVRVANNLDRARFRVSIVAARGGGSYEGDLAPDVDYCPLNATGLLSRVMGLRHVVRRQRPDLIFSVLDNANCVALIATIGMSPAPPVVAGVQIPPSIEYRQNATMSKRALLFAIRRMYPRAAHVVALSEGVKLDVIGLVPSVRDTTSVIYNAGFDDSVVRLAAEPIETHRANGSRVVVACGRLTRQKGFDGLLAAFARVRERIPAQLWIVGDGELRSSLEAQAERLGLGESVWFTGFQRNPYRFMRAADVFVLSSLWEGFGNVIVEAMAVGTPVVAADCPFGPAEIIRDGEVGLLFPPGDETAMSEAIMRVLEDATLGAKLAEMGRKRADDFWAPRAAEAYGRLFEGIIAA